MIRSRPTAHDGTLFVGRQANIGRLRQTIRHGPRAQTRGKSHAGQQGIGGTIAQPRLVETVALFDGCHGGGGGRSIVAAADGRQEAGAAGRGAVVVVVAKKNPTRHGKRQVVGEMMPVCPRSKSIVSTPKELTERRQ